MTAGAVVLAAGSSSRMPTHKLLLPFAGKPLIRHAVEAAAASRAAPVVVVTGHAAAAVEAALQGLGVWIVENKDFSKGLSESLKCGLGSLPPACEAAVILLGDMPLVTAGLIDALIAAFDPARGRAICVPVRGGRRGNPVLWGRQFFPELLALDGDAGAKRLMALHEDVLHPLEVADDAAFIDIDTRDDLGRASLVLGGRKPGGERS